MYHGLLSDDRLYAALVRFDEDLAEQTRSAGCPCGGKLHSARFPRKSRGGPATLPPEYDKRLSFCCAVEGCRQRATPPSVRFLGQRVYLAVVVVLASAMANGLTASRVSRLCKEIGVSVRTLKRWRKWWQEVFTQTPFWKSARGRLVPPVDEKALPAVLLERFTGRTRKKRLEALLQFVCPITTAWLPRKSSFLMGI